MAYHLASENSVPVPEPVALAEGALVQELDAADRLCDEVSVHRPIYYRGRPATAYKYTYSWVLYEYPY